MKCIALLLLITVYCKNTFAQLDSSEQKLAIFLPISLNNYFDKNNKALGDITKDAKNIVDYYTGAKLALKKLGTDGKKLAVNIYEINKTTNLDSLWNTANFKNTNLILAPVKDDIKLLAQFAAAHQITFISTLSPLDGGVTNNNQFYMCNPTIRVHIEEMYNYIKNKITTNKWTDPNILLVKTNSNKDLALYTHFINMEKKQLDKNFKTTTLNFNSSALPPAFFTALDSTKKNVVYSFSLNDTLNEALLKATSKLKNYNILVLGLPYWENFTFLKTDALKDARFVYSTAYHKFELDSAINKPILNAYKKKHIGFQPNYSFYKGYIYTYKYANLLATYGPNFIAHINDTNLLENNKLIFAPYLINNTNLNLNYFENRKLYFITQKGNNFLSIDN